MANLVFEVLKVLAGSPFFKDLVRRVANEAFDPVKVERGVREFLGKELELTGTLISLMPRSVNAAFGVLGGISTYASSFPSEVIFTLLKGAVNEFDAAYAAKVFNNLFDLIEGLRKEHPKLLADLTREKIGEFIDSLDFGKLKRFIEGSATCAYGVFEVVNEKILSNPVKISNLAFAIPPVLNAAVAIVHDALRRLELPSEVLANALFALVNKLDMEQVGKTISTLSAIINKVHEGNYILGRGDRKFKEVARDLMERLITSINMDDFAKAANALLEDLSDLSDALTEALWKNPVTVMSLAPLIPAALNTLTGMIAKSLSKLSELPTDLSAQIASSLLKEVDVKKLGDVLTGVAKMVNGVCESDPKAISNFLNSIIASSDKKELEKMLSNVIRSLMDVVASNPGMILSALTPIVQSLGRLLAKGGRGGGGA